MTVVNLALVKSHIDLTREANDSRIQLVLDAALEMATEIIGPLSGTASGRVTSNGTELVLPSIPVVSVTTVTSVVDPETAIDLSGYTVDETNGIIYGLPPGTYDVTYQAGWTTVNGAPDLPADMALGVVELVRSMWKMYQRPAGSRGNQEPALTTGGLYDWARDRFARYRTMKVG